MTEQNDIMDRYFRGEFIERKAVKDAIAEVEKQAKHIEYNYNTDIADGMYRAINIFRKHTGVSK